MNTNTPVQALKGSILRSVRENGVYMVRESARNSLAVIELLAERKVAIRKARYGGFILEAPSDLFGGR